MTRQKMLTRATPYLFILPCAILVFIVLLYPVSAGIVKSLYNENLLIPAPVKFVGVQNFGALFSDPLFLGALHRSIVWTLVILVFEMIFGMFFALFLNANIYCKKLLRCLILIPWVIPNAISGIIWKWFLNESYGFLNYLLRSMRFIEHNLPWLSNNELAAISVVCIIIWKNIPFVTITLLAGLQSISPDLYEAARVDGAGFLTTFFRITMPMISSIILITGILTSIWNFNQLDIIQVVTRGGPGVATLSMPIFIYRLFMESFQTSYASSAAVVMMIIMTIPTVIYVRKLLKR
ncbi:MAG: sugar ABC transporter permease [Treponema sp.]|jgi:multiple sugar transport system permease protein|nr:sugar ABC transporter permease [Treponema sp.]